MSLFAAKANTIRWANLFVLTNDRTRLKTQARTALMDSKFKIVERKVPYTISTTRCFDDRLGDSLSGENNMRDVIFIGTELTWHIHCVESVQIWSFFSSVFSRIRPEYGEILLKSFKDSALLSHDLQSPSA